MRILVYGGWFGSGNLGDEAILIGIRNIFKKTLPEAQLRALSIDPERTEAVTGVEAVHLESPRTLLRNRETYINEFREADACIVTGGTPFYDYGHLSRIIHMGLPAITEKKLICFGVGSKPIRSLQGREITRVLLRQSRRISTRDQPSKDVLGGIIRKPGKGLTLRPINVTGDSAMHMTPEVRHDPDGRTILFCPRRLSVEGRKLYHEKLDTVVINKVRHMQAIAADGLIRQGYDVKFVPFHTVAPDDDREEISLIRRLMSEEAEELPRPKSPVDAIHQISRAIHVVGLRLHSLVLASSCGTPFTTIDYDIKIGGFMKNMGLVELSCGTREKLGRLGETTLGTIEDRRYPQRILGRSSQIRKRILDEAENASSFIRGITGERDTLSRLQPSIRSR